jgi:hypothetical protein
MTIRGRTGFATWFTRVFPEERGFGGVGRSRAGRRWTSMAVRPGAPPSLVGLVHGRSARGGFDFLLLSRSETGIGNYQVYFTLLFDARYP